MFKFKKFSVRQDKTAMKVGTDGVLLGAWANFSATGNILDIGTGTGLISLMAAQRSNARITGIDICPDSVEQASSNFSLCEWSDRLQAVNISLQKYAETESRFFDYIVCNPPFYNGSYIPTDRKRTVARHSTELSIDELFKFSYKLLSDTGILGIISPIENFESILNSCSKNNLFIIRQTSVKPNFEKPVKRILLEFSKVRQILFQNTLIIESDQRHVYTNEYIKLTKDFYLKM